MTTQSTPQSTASWRLILMGVLLLFVIGGMIVLIYSVFTSQFPGMNDFMSRWEGARSFFQESISPYSEQASLNIQMRIYGGPASASQDPGYFVYPFYAVFYVGPTVFLEYAWASAIWMVVLMVCLVAALLLLLNLYAWKPRTWLLTILILWALFDYYPGRGLFLGQPSHIVYVLQVAAIWALFKKHEVVAGVALALSTMKPQMGYMMVPLLLLWGLRYRHWRFLASFGVIFGLLMGISFLLQPDWLGDWLYQVQLYPQYTSIAYPDTGSPVWIIVQHYLGLGDLGEALISVIVIGTVSWSWYHLLIGQKQNRLLWTILLTLAATHLIAMRTATPHFVIYNLVLIFYFKLIGMRYGQGSVLLLIIALLISNWLLFMVTVQGRGSAEHPVMFLPMSVIMFFLLLVDRQRWWTQAAPQLILEMSADQS